MSSLIKILFLVISVKVLLVIAASELHPEPGSPEKGLEGREENLNGSSSSVALPKTFDEKDKLSINDIHVDYPELKPGRPITAYLVIGIVFVTLAVTPYLFYALYLLVTPAPLRHHLFRSKRSTKKRKEYYYYSRPISSSASKVIPNHHTTTPWYPPVPPKPIADNNYYNNAGDSSECLERVFCRLSRSAFDYGVPSWVESAMESVAAVNPRWKGRMLRGMYSSGGECKNFHCNPLGSVWSDMKSYVSNPVANEIDNSPYLEGYF